MSLLFLKFTVSDEIAKLDFFVICAVHDGFKEGMLSHKGIGDKARFMDLDDWSASWNVLCCEYSLSHVLSHFDFD